MRKNNRISLGLLDVYAPGSSINSRTRLNKLKKFLLSRGVGINYYGWERILGELSKNRSEEFGVKEKSLLKGGGYANSMVRVYYLLWFMKVFFHVLLFKRNRIIWCLGWETAFPAYLASAFKGNTIVFDDADRFSMLFKLPRLFKYLIELTEKYLSFSCSWHVVPGFSRYSWKHERMFLLRNTPLTETIDQVSDLEYSINHTFRIYMNGWIAWDTGAAIVQKALDILYLEDIDFQLKVAGKIVSSEGRELIQKPYVHYLGELEQSEAMRVYKESDLVITAYDPSVEVNKFAESNKWADCVLMECPFIVNEEIESAVEYVKAGIANTFPYANYCVLSNRIKQLISSREKLNFMKNNSILYKRNIVPFDVSLARLFDQIDMRG